MAKSRKDNKGRVLRKVKLSAVAMASMFIPIPIRKENAGAFTLKILWNCVRGKKKLIKDQLDGLDTYVAGSATVNFVLTGIYLQSQNSGNNHEELQIYV